MKPSTFKTISTIMLLFAVLASGCSRRTPSMEQASAAATASRSADAADNGKIRLSGVVQDRAQIERAVRTVRDVEDVKSAQNRMSVKKS